MKTYYKLIEEYPTSDKVGTIFFVKPDASVTKVDYNLNDVSNTPTTLRLEHLMPKYYEKYFRISKDGFPLFNGDRVFIINTNSTISSLMFDINNSYPDNVPLFKYESNCEKVREELFRKAFPKTWKECKVSKGWFVSNNSEIKFWNADGTSRRLTDANKNTFVTEKQAGIQLAYSQLTQIAKKLNDNWIPNWSDVNENKYVINRIEDKLVKEHTVDTYSQICFKSADLRDYAVDTFNQTFREYFELN